MVMQNITANLILLSGIVLLNYKTIFVNDLQKIDMRVSQLYSCLCNLKV